MLLVDLFFFFFFKEEAGIGDVAVTGVQPFPLPFLWRGWIDTFLDPPQDIVPWQSASSVSGQTYRAGPRSVVVLWSTNADQSKYAPPSVNPKLPSFMAK